MMAEQEIILSLRGWGDYTLMNEKMRCDARILMQQENLENQIIDNQDTGCCEKLLTSLNKRHLLIAAEIKRRNLP